ncbi:aldose epimerase family protein [Massilia sp. S19_KUP03_FR1]|uniref:aldose epimerase family protein n=1 Tax=Massilia sp. S19_KUP03_FR1 TaxID=3025503 RepID=UPI002FCD8FBA
MNRLASPAHAITRAPFGRLPDGREASLFTLINAAGMVATITDFGGIVTSLSVPDRAGHLANVVLGFDALAPYLSGSAYFGALIGRYGNRIARGQFTLDGADHQLTVNNGAHHLHGGARGFDKVLWDAHIAGTALVLQYTSVDGEQGYPGTLVTTVEYELLDSNELVMRVHAVTDRATPVNITQHSYFNLAGQGDILGHELTLYADAFTSVDEGLIPLGARVPVAGTPFDFRSSRSIGERIGQPDKQLRHGAGYDHNFVLSGATELAARVLEPVSGRVLELFTTEPGVQFYSGNFLDGSQGFARRSGFCLEPQHFPDGPNQPGFPGTILRPGATYTTSSRWRFSTDANAI